MKWLIVERLVLAAASAVVAMAVDRGLLDDRGGELVLQAAGVLVRAALAPFGL